MRRKILLMIAIVAMLACVFAISISAESITDNEISYEITKGATEELNTAVIGNNKENF